MIRRLRLAFALAGMVTAACSSFRVTVVSAQPDQVSTELRSLCILVGKESDLKLPDGADPSELASTSRQKLYDAFLQFAPDKVVKGKLLWRKTHEAGTSPKRIGVKLAPLSAKVDGDLVKRSETIVVLLAMFKSGASAMKKVNHDDLLEIKSFNFDLQGEELVLR